MKKKRFRRCNHEKVVVFPYREKMHKCRECELREYAEKKYPTEGRPQGLSFGAYCRKEFGGPLKPCSWPELCGKTVTQQGIFSAKCSACKIESSYASSPFGALRAFGRIVKRFK